MIVISTNVLNDSFGSRTELDQTAYNKLLFCSDFDIKITKLGDFAHHKYLFSQSPYSIEIDYLIP